MGNSMSRRVMSLILVFAAATALVPSSASISRADGMYSIIDLGTLPGTTQSIATGLNNNGDVVGISYNQSNKIGAPGNHPLLTFDAGAQSFEYNAGSITQIHPTGGLAREINDPGQILGAPRACYRL